MLAHPHAHLATPLRTPWRPMSPAARKPSLIDIRQPPPTQPPATAQAVPIPVLSSRPTPSPVSADRLAPLQDILAAGDIIGTAVELQGELIRQVNLPTPALPPGSTEPADLFEVVRPLGTGSYAVVYLVREVFCNRTPRAVDDWCATGILELDGATPQRAERTYGREYAVKCLSKANLNQEALDAQMLEASVQQSLPVHPNIVTLYRTLETSAFLLLILECVPGEDLFYFLEQSRDHQVDFESEPNTPLDLSITPPTPSLLSNTSQMLSRGRLRLIASMFSQMCDAVAACHRVNVFHRDIKPENFIVTDATFTGPDGRRERRVVVKLTDFGLATTDVESADMECGSAPYMSYECRTNCAPTYCPQPADVWSLGIVLINMLYHRNPWSEPKGENCPSFDFFLQHPVQFFVQSFLGMNTEVAGYLADKVFCLLETPDDTRRVSAHDFGVWVKQLPAMMGAPGYPRRSTLQPGAPGKGVHVPSATLASTSRAELHDDELPMPELVFSGSSAESQVLAEPAERSPSTHRRRKRGLRKGKAAQAAALGSPSLPAEEDRLEQMASANQDLVRELSRISNRSSVSKSSLPLSPVSPPPVPPLPSPVVRKSRWMNVFRTKEIAVEPLDASIDADDALPRNMSATASNVSNLIMGLSAPVPDPEVRGRRRERRDEAPAAVPTVKARAPAPALESRPGGSTSDLRSERNTSPVSTRSGPRSSNVHLGPSFQSANWRNSTSSSASSAAASHYTRFSNSSIRSVSTTATSLSNSSWRERQQANDLKTTHGNIGGVPPLRRRSNVKDMSGIPWELHELPRQCTLVPTAHVFDGPPSPKAPKAPPRRLRPEALSTINEGQHGHAPRNLTVYTRQDASTSTTGLSPPNSPRSLESASPDGPKKMPKGQSNPLAKIFSTLKPR